MKKKIIIISSIVAVLAVGGISGAVIYTNSNKDVDTSVNVAENDIDENEVEETVIDEEDELIEEVTEKEEDTTSDDKKTAEKKVTDKDNVDRIQIERFFSTAKRRNGLGLTDRKREDTSLMTIALSVLVTNIFGTFKLAVEEIEKENDKAKKR